MLLFVNPIESFPIPRLSDFGFSQADVQDESLRIVVEQFIGSHSNPKSSIDDLLAEVTKLAPYSDTESPQPCP